MYKNNYDLWAQSGVPEESEVKWSNIWRMHWLQHGWNLVPDPVTAVLLTIFKSVVLVVHGQLFEELHLHKLH
jgi:hypothetical protein